MNNKKYQKCPICQSPSIISGLPDGGDGLRIECFRCGNYIISDSAFTERKDFSNVQIANISGWLRQNQGEQINTRTLERFAKLITPNIIDKSIKLLKHIAKERPTPGQWIQIDFQSIYDLRTLKEDTEYPKEVFEKLEKSLPFLSITWALDGSELRYIINDYLIEEQGYLTGDKRYKITPKGWAYIESLKYKNVDSQIAFIAMWFDDSMNNVHQSIENSLLETGYEPKRVDRHEHVNRIDDEIIALIRQSKFIVADYTGQRWGVYFESGFAHGLGLPVVWTCKEDDLDNLHFDTSHYNFLTWEEDKFPEFEEKLKNRILAVIGKGTYNPE